MTKIIFEQEIQQILKEWERYQPRRRWPGGGPLPSLGKLQLRRYLDNYVKEHHCLPEGNHNIPAGEDIFGKINAGFSVYFPRKNFQKFDAHLERALKALLLEYDFGNDPAEVREGIKQFLQATLYSAGLDRVIDKIIPKEA